MFAFEVCCVVVCGDFDCCELCVGMWLVWVLWDGFLYSLYDGISLKCVIKGFKGKLEQKVKKKNKKKKSQQRI